MAEPPRKTPRTDDLRQENSPSGEGGEVHGPSGRGPPGGHSPGTRWWDAGSPAGNVGVGPGGYIGGGRS